MPEYQTLFDGPNAIALGDSDFTPGEIAGMRTAGVVLLADGIASLAVSVLTREPQWFGLVDCFLGVQLLRSHHSWRSWAILRAGLGALGAAIGLASGLVSGIAPGTLLALLAVLLYCGSLLLWLYGSPSRRRVMVGWILIPLWVLLFLGSVVVTAALHARPVAVSACFGTNCRGDGRAAAERAPTKGTVGFVGPLPW